MGNLSQVPLDTTLVHGFLDVSSMKSVNMGLFRKVFFEKIPLNRGEHQWYSNGFLSTKPLKPPGGGADPMSERLREGS